MTDGTEPHEVELVDVNPEKLSSNNYLVSFGVSVNGMNTSIPVQGYKSISINSGGNGTFYFADSSGNNIGSALSVVTYSWSDFDIPNDAVFLKVIGTYSSTNASGYYYSLVA